MEVDSVPRIAGYLAEVEVKLEKLNFDELYAEAEAAQRIGECPICEGQERLLCFCGVCLKYCHNDYHHEDMDDEGDENLRGLI